jgi:hypothetical protein
LDQDDIADLISVACIDFMEASDVDLYDNDVGGRRGVQEIRELVVKNRAVRH